MWPFLQPKGSWLGPGMFSARPQDGEEGFLSSSNPRAASLRVQWLSEKEHLINTKPFLITFWEL